MEEEYNIIWRNKTKRLIKLKVFYKMFQVQENLILNVKIQTNMFRRLTLVIIKKSYTTRK